jgi:hypothetical protein
VKLLNDVGADLAGGGQDPKEVPTRQWPQPVSDASHVLPKHRGASVSAVWRPGERQTKLLDRPGFGTDIELERGRYGEQNRAAQASGASK